MFVNLSTRQNNQHRLTAPMETVTQGVDVHTRLKSYNPPICLLKRGKVVTLPLDIIVCSTLNMDQRKQERALSKEITKNMNKDIDSKTQEFKNIPLDCSEVGAYRVPYLVCSGRVGQTSC
ncbi:hypothetical protein DPEC_G00320440 [Dallia pectoralis]|uniref:Uncharacterized protein n=1 Tax=Dallia pectoralis TaxID=75939 RepID=A0ACC2F9Q9_DALPE|nr:hypothetical protein DPEC_G00320440 [Dallia pectoralis]